MTPDTAMEKNRLIRILIACQQGIFCDGLHKLLEAESDFHVVGDASDPSEAVKMACQLRPDILLLGLALLQHEVPASLRALESLPAPVRPLLLVDGIDKEQLIQALQAGVRGVVPKESATELLIKGIRRVMAGQYWLGRETVSDLVRALRELQPGSNGNGCRNNFGLTSREREIIGTIVAGYTNKDIAQKFSLSEQTVKHHLTNIFDKLGVSNRLELALFAVNQRLVGDADSSGNASGH